MIWGGEPLFHTLFGIHFANSSFGFLKIPNKRIVNPMRNKTGSKSIINATSANPSPTLIATSIETDHDNNVVITNMVVIPEIITTFLRDFPRLIIKAKSRLDTMIATTKIINTISNESPSFFSFSYHSNHRTLFT